MRSLSGAQRSNIVPSHRRNPYAKSTHRNESSIDKYGLCVAASSAEDKVKFDDLDLDFDAICKISKTLDFESYINLSDFKFSQSNNQEIIAYPIYSQTNSMSANNSGGNTNMGGSKKNRNQNTSNQNNMQCDPNDKQQHVKIETEENSYGIVKQDSQQTQQSGGYYQHQSQDHDAGMSTNQQQPVPNYYHQSTAAPIYYCPTPEYNESNVYPSEMVMPHGVYAVPAHAYQVPPMQSNNMYAPVAGNQHYPVHVGGWSGYNPQG